MFLLIYYFSRTIGFLLIISALILAAYYQRIKSRWVETRGQIVSIKEQKVDTGKQVYSLYIPIFNYQVGEKTYPGQGPSAQVQKAHQVGETIVIRFNPQKPEKYIIPGKNHDYLNFIYLLGAGIMLVILSFLLH